MSAPAGPTVAIIDVGSNSIKALVACRDSAGQLRTLHTRSLDARISAGISGARPQLAEAGLRVGVEAICSLLAGVAPFKPQRTLLVATSAVRDAANGGAFAARIEAATGLPLEILSGEAEANLIGRGLTADPELADLRDFQVFDLGGGSLECLAFRARRIVQAASLPLGCVRLTEKLVSDVTAPVPAGLRLAVARHVREVFAEADFSFSSPSTNAAVGTGGTVATVRSILAARAGCPFEQTAAAVPVAQLDAMLTWLGGLTLPERQLVPGLARERADVFPVALATLLAVAELGGFSTLRHSLYNLRYGLADQLLPR